MIVLETKEVIAKLTKGQKYMEWAGKDEDDDKALFIEFEEPIMIEAGFGLFDVYKIAYWNNEDWISLYGEGGFRMGTIFPTDLFSIRKDSHMSYFYAVPRQTNFPRYEVNEVIDAIFDLFKP